MRESQSYIHVIPANGKSVGSRVASVKAMRPLLFCLSGSSVQMMRARVYIDGFNFYYRRLQSSNTKWTNLKSLAELLLLDGDHIDKIRYFTADVSPRAGDLEAPIRQATYFRALKTIPELEIHKGSFLTKKIKRPLVEDPERYVLVRDTEEKGSDVNLASHLLMDAFCDTFDVALIFSQDTDLLEPLRMVSQELNKRIVMAWYADPQAGRRHREYATAIRHVSDAMLRKSQFPDPVIGQGGTKIYRPNSWSSGGD
ncbi:NYN domain-containing protein [Sulfitobacter pseudonitzschiae]|uniref:NYN domain-containing protein n=1 Tax=Pseudosulfitobacter pseudonitzschiae TaxID=1402135 RepID=UPI001AF49753|nr:NYN domain-containing protein [Pseudosulfitobacter pseudonitzschiae]MBM1815523.1 NYN domain-containing protein [Pseudosulfitobacter pseudonitzschiae]MBM1832514.1 NYN domain-containing protein [Pseudosulfitobacter pseudonitzschiae]MBM1842228.1 NYN domain-containing protein [Pseudosulfitobacter pseudonitzschiae]MBM1851937.1 NYN domain-containing protein [Pseudosulfitobacter pseudonitzschiae]MBM1856776.1 NYN domain-containing protein [Pseudosulfitobacter pseudonitzschiae]